MYASFILFQSRKKIELTYVAQINATDFHAPGNVNGQFHGFRSGLAEVTGCREREGGVIHRKLAGSYGTRRHLT